MAQHGPGEHGEARINNARRLALLQSFKQQELLEFGLAWAEQWIHSQTAGTPLPAACPARDKLVAARYSAIEDLDGANIDELLQNVPGITEGDARAALDFLGFKTSGFLTDF